MAPRHDHTLRSIFTIDQNQIRKMLEVLVDVIQYAA